MEEMYTKFWSGNVKGRNHSDDIDVDGRIILEWILEKEVDELYTECIWLRIETSGGFFEKTNKASGNVKGWKFVD
jgi:hypothetical protein